MTLGQQRGDTISPANKLYSGILNDLNCLHVGPGLGRHAHQERVGVGFAETVSMLVCYSRTAPCRTLNSADWLFVAIRASLGLLDGSAVHQAESFLRLSSDVHLQLNIYQVKAAASGSPQVLSRSLCTLQWCCHNYCGGL